MNQLLNMLARAVGRRVNDAGNRQLVQVEATKDELIDDVPRMQNYGFTSVPEAAGSDAVVVFLGGIREQGIIVVMDNQKYRLTGLQTGEVAMYDDLGNVVKLGRDSLEVIAVTKATVTAPEVEVTATTSAKLTAGASSITVTPASVAIVSTLLTHNGKNIGATHYHVGSPSTAVPV